MDLRSIQEANEYYYDKHTVRDHIRKEIEENDRLLGLIDIATAYVTTWAEDFNGYESKNKRLAILLEQDIKELIIEIQITVINLDNRNDLLTSIAGQSCKYIENMDYRQQLVTAAEIINHMCDCDLFDMMKAPTKALDEEGNQYSTESWYISNPWPIGEKCKKHIERGIYLPPMVVHPRTLRKNTDTGYLTKRKGSLILGNGNHHDEDICLDALNIQNSVELCLNVEMVKEVGEIIDDETKQILLEDEERRTQYEKFMKVSYEVYATLIKYGNRFWITHKVDKRGRSYAQAYHANYQGNSFRKSIIELANKETVSGFDSL